MSDNMFKFIMTLVPVFGAIITYFVIPYIKSKVSQTQMEEIIKWVTKAVEAAEVLFDVPKSGEEKREYVIKFIDKMFNSKKEVITEEQILHIEEGHPGDYGRLSAYISQVLQEPDYILRGNRPHTALVLKEISTPDLTAEIILRLKVSSDPEEYKNSIITMWSISQKRFRRLLRQSEILYKKG